MKTKPTLLYRVAKKVVQLYFRLFFKWRIYGADNIPNTGSVILVSNHISNLDPPLVACSIKRQVHFMAKEELFRLSIVGRFLKLLGAFPVKRGDNDLRAVKTGLDILKNNKILGIFPEGTRSKDGKIGKALPGAALFALRTDATVIPVGIVSNFNLFTPILISFGEPLSMEDYKKNKYAQDDLQNTMNYIMDKIAMQINKLKENYL